MIPLALFLAVSGLSARAEDPATPEVAVSTPSAATPAEKPRGPLMPPPLPARPKSSLDSAGDVARDLAAAVEYFEAGQSYYRAFTKGSHTPEENKAFVQFLEDYEKELAIARKTHSLLGAWLERKSSVRD
ncbi:MAG: hypothetical protein HYZ74_02095 [Elusimicrobia bacterium]|nr:hypothetical protein [Elusimicrobiota bacterium]